MSMALYFASYSDLRANADLAKDGKGAGSLEGLVPLILLE
jgi:hypothetical protein